MTDKEHIQQLLERYMASETTIEEERELKEFFSSHDDFPKAWAAYAVMFQGMSRRDSSSIVERKSSLLKWTIGVAASLLIASLVLWMLYDKDNVVTQETKIAKVEQHEESDTDDALAELDKEAEEKPTKVMPKPTQKPKVAVKSAPVGTEIEESEEPTDAELMAQYIAANFMTIEERQRLEMMESAVMQPENGDVEINECLNGIGIMVGNDGL
ncbi:MAG: hypothetical protein IJ910_04490 [Bacteroidaceae bacterium]|nr:hypothetical protein [Bacteroidaceae bacterium]